MPADENQTLFKLHNLLNRYITVSNNKSHLSDDQVPSTGPAWSDNIVIDRTALDAQEGRTRVVPKVLRGSTEKSISSYENWRYMKNRSASE